jgi:hypothetical protein
MGKKYGQSHNALWKLIHGLRFGWSIEPSIGLQTLYSLSRGAPSATRPRLQEGAILTRLAQLLSVMATEQSTIAIM